jgi:hypothetical protein
MKTLSEMLALALGTIVVATIVVTACSSDGGDRAAPVTSHAEQDTNFPIALGTYSAVKEVLSDGSENDPGAGDLDFISLQKTGNNTPADFIFVRHLSGNSDEAEGLLAGRFEFTSTNGTPSIHLIQQTADCDGTAPPFEEWLIIESTPDKLVLRPGAHANGTTTMRLVPISQSARPAIDAGAVDARADAR